MRTVVRALVDPSLSVPGFLTCGAVLKRLHCIRRTLGASEARRSASNVCEALDRVGRLGPQRPASCAHWLPRVTAAASCANRTWPATLA